MHKKHCTGFRRNSVCSGSLSVKRPLQGTFAVLETKILDVCYQQMPLRSRSQHLILRANDLTTRFTTLSGENRLPTTQTIGTRSQLPALMRHGIHCLNPLIFSRTPLIDGGFVLPNATFVGKSQQLIFEVIRSPLIW